VNVRSRPGQRGSGALVVNADDWGRDRETTDRTLDCIQTNSVSSVSAMVFMQDSERAATLARERGIDAGLHLNFTSPFTGGSVSARLSEHQGRVCTALRAHRLAPVVYHPRLTASFDYVVKTQLDEFYRLFGTEPARVDGHHHMHLCANVLARNLIPAGRIVRRNFSFRRGEKGVINRSYRALVDRWLARRHPLVDYLFTLPPIEPRARLERIFALASESIVELETHPVDPCEYRFLASGEIHRRIGRAEICSFMMLPMRVGRRAVLDEASAFGRTPVGRERH
jgi:chitin disaccharide deacetylase